MTRLARRSDDRPAWAIWMVAPFILNGAEYARHYLAECDGQRLALSEADKRMYFTVQRPSRAKR